jgi:hypothetical protein
MVAKPSPAEHAPETTEVVDAGPSPARPPNVLAVFALLPRLRAVMTAEEMESFALMGEYVDLGSEGAEGRLLELRDGTDAAMDTLDRYAAGVLPGPSFGHPLDLPAAQPPRPRMRGVCDRVPRRGPRRRGAGRPARRRSSRVTRAGPDDDPDESHQLGGPRSTATLRRNEAGGGP